MQLDSRTCLFPGRFQPFHNGHADVVDRLAGFYRRLIISISQAHLSHTSKDPFTGGERYEMIRQYVDSANLWGRVDIVPVPIDSFPTIWVPFIRSIAPPFEVVYARNPLIQSIFSHWGYQLHTSVIERTTSGSAVRETILNSGEWTRLVPVT